MKAQAAAGKETGRDGIMKKFKSLSSKSVSENEKQISAFWDEIRILDKSIKTREGNKPFIFYEGPPTANTLDSSCDFQDIEGFRMSL